MSIDLGRTNASISATHGKYSMPIAQNREIADCLIMPKNIECEEAIKSKLS
jgi:hypothetical protein